MQISGICTKCGKVTKNPQSCILCGAIVGDCCYRASKGICKTCGANVTI